MFKIYKCEVRGKKEHLVKDEVTTNINVANGYESNQKHYAVKKKINGNVSGDYKLYYYDLKDIESGKLFSMKTEHDIVVDEKPLYIGVEGEDIIAFSRNEMNGNSQKNYTLIEEKSATLTAREIFIGIGMFIMYLIPLISITTNFMFIKDMANTVKQDYKNYPALIMKIVMGLIMLYQAKSFFMISTNARSFSAWYDMVQGATTYTGLLSFAIVIGSICYFKWNRLKNLEQFNHLEKKGA
jgi:hypothetical protein